MTLAYSRPDGRLCGNSHDLQECGGREGQTRRDGRQSDIKSDRDRQTSEEERDILHA